MRLIKEQDSVNTGKVGNIAKNSKVIKIIERCFILLEGWLQLANETGNDDCWKEIMLALRDSHTHVGQKKDNRALDELLIGDKARLKDHIEDYLFENPGTSRLAYLLYALRQSIILSLATISPSIEHYKQLPTNRLVARMFPKDAIMNCWLIPSC